MALKKDTYEKGHIKKRAMVKALKKTLGIVTDAIDKVGIARSTHYDWLNDDPSYKKAVDDLSDVALDFAESKLLNQIKEDNTTAIIFYLKTKGKARGYIERLNDATQFFQQINNHQSGNKQIEEDLSKLTDDELKDYMNALQKMGQSDKAIEGEVVEVED